MYLKEIGKVPLLSADEEIELAQNMEDGAVATEKINVLKGRLDGASEEEKAEIKEEIKTLQRMWTREQMPKASCRSKPASCCQHRKEICGKRNAFP